MLNKAHTKRLAATLLLGFSALSAHASESPWLVSIGISSVDSDTYLHTDNGDWDADFVGSARQGPSLALSRELANGWSLRLLHTRFDGLRALNACPDRPGIACAAVAFYEDYRLNTTELTALRTFRTDEAIRPFLQFGVQHAGFEAEDELPDDNQTEWLAGVGLAYQVNDTLQLALEWQASGADLQTIRANVGIGF